MARGQRIGDLILDHLRRLARILGVDDDLNVGEIGDGVERHVRDRHRCRRATTKTVAIADQEDVPRRPADERGDHGGASGW